MNVDFAIGAIFGAIAVVALVPPLFKKPQSLHCLPLRRTGKSPAELELLKNLKKLEEVTKQLQATAWIDTSRDRRAIGKPVDRVGDRRVRNR